MPSMKRRNIIPVQIVYRMLLDLVKCITESFMSAPGRVFLSNSRVASHIWDDPIYYIQCCNISCAERVQDPRPNITKCCVNGMAIYISQGASLLYVLNIEGFPGDPGMSSIHHDYMFILYAHFVTKVLYSLVK